MNRITGDDRIDLVNNLNQLQYHCSWAKVTLDTTDTLDAAVLDDIKRLGHDLKKITDRVNDVFRRKAATETTP